MIFQTFKPAFYVTLDMYFFFCLPSCSSVFVSNLSVPLLRLPYLVPTVSRHSLHPAIPFLSFHSFLYKLLSVSASPKPSPLLLRLSLPTGRRTARFHPLPRKQGPKFRAAVVDLAAGDGSTEGGPAWDSNIVLNRRNFNLIRVCMSILGHGSACKLGEHK